MLNNYKSQLLRHVRTHWFTTLYAGREYIIKVSEGTINKKRLYCETRKITKKNKGL